MKSFNLKSLILSALIMGGIFALFSLPRPTLAAGEPCYDITGSSTPVAISGTQNSGTLNFDDAGVAPSVQACVRMNSTMDKPDHLEGWVWDNNLGWISLYCKGGMNLGMSCGSKDYQVNFTTSGTGPDFSSVQLSGWAWGDNTGYISFSCVAGGNSGYSCGSYTYAASPKAANPNRGKLNGTNASTMIWSDAVGWFDLSGVTLDWTGPLTVTTVPVTVTPSTGGSAAPADGGPGSGGSGSWSITIPVGVDLSNVENCGSASVNLTTTSISGKQYCGWLKLDWHDSVDYDQTTAASQNENPSGVDPYDATSGVGAVTKPLGYDFNTHLGGLTVSGLTNLVGNVTSLAPTSDRNASDGFSNEKFYFVDSSKFPDASYNISKSDQNVLKLNSLSLMLFKYSTDGSTPGSCVIGDTTAVPGKCSAVIPVSNKSISFDPLASVSKLVFKKGTKDLNYIEITNPDQPQYFDYQISGTVTPTVNMNIGLSNGGPYSMKYDDDTDLKTFSSVSSGTLNAKISTTDTGSSFPPDVQPYLFSRISYSLGAKTISYFANKLPRVRAGLLINPVAKVQGNVYATDIGQKTSDFTIRSLGNISSNLKREQILRNVERYKRGITLSGYSSGVTISNPDSISSNLDKLLDLPNKAVYYLKNADLELNCPGGCLFKKNTTFIVENGSIQVDSNIGPDPTAKSTQIGLISLRGLDAGGKGGFLYIDKNVGLMENTQIYADKLLESYIMANGYGGMNGYPLSIGDDSARQSTFNNQLVVVGTVSSMNGIGNASRLKPVDENGQEVVLGACDYNNISGLSGLCKARNADLNYLRYYGPGLESCSTGGVPRDQKLKAADPLNPASGCDPTNPAYAIDASCVYDSSTVAGQACDLVLGGAGSGAASSYFNGSKAMADQYPVNFFYKPISKDLAGFETEINLNPTIQN